MESVKYWLTVLALVVAIAPIVIGIIMYFWGMYAENTADRSINGDVRQIAMLGGMKLIALAWGAAGAIFFLGRAIDFIYTLFVGP